MQFGYVVDTATDVTGATEPPVFDRESIVAFQTAVVERVRALLEVRTSLRVGSSFDGTRARYEKCCAEIRAIIDRHELPFMARAQALGLGEREIDALGLIAAPHLDNSIRASIAGYHGGPSRRHVDVALVLDLLYESRGEALAARHYYGDGGVLHRAGLVEPVALSLSHMSSSLEHELVPTPRLLRLLDGDDGLDSRFRGIGRVIDADPTAHRGVVSDELVAQIAKTVAGAESALSTSRGVAMLATGSHGVGKLRLLRALASCNDIAQLFVVEAALLPADPVRLARVLRELVDEANASSARLVLRGIEHLCDSRRAAAVFLGILRGIPAVLWATSDLDPRVDDAPQLATIAGFVLPIAYPDLTLRHAAWNAELERAGIGMLEETVRDLASEYPITRSAIGDIVGTMVAAGENPAALPRLAESRVPGQLARYARRSRNQARLAHLVLADSTKEQLVEVLEAVRNRRSAHDRWGIAERHAVGRGIVAMFNGPPGTGKTMASNVIANELGMPLFRIDTSNIVDRYVGETEKNLARLFDEASASRAALLFDEADSLFGKRVDAKDATDRHANMQINVLLNLIEDYDGFVVLTTNMKGALDSAFLRRIVYKIAFDLPDLEERIALWKYHLPDSIPQARIDYHALADEFDRTSGGDIKNAVTRAVLSCRGQAPVTESLLVRCMQNELRANGSVIADEGLCRKR
jgi:hypothetical protein